MDHMPDPAAMCVAVVGGALVLGTGLLPRPSLWGKPWAALRLVVRPASRVLLPRAAPARAGPAVLQVFRL